MIRNIGAVFVGLIVGSVANMALIMGSWAIYPPPEGLDMSDQAQMAAFIATLPTGAFLMAIVAHLAQAAIGGWVAARLAGSHPLRLAMIVGALSMLGGVANMFQIDAPTWMWAEMPLYLAVAWGAGTLELRRRAHKE
jgi:hypothetical protein